MFKRKYIATLFLSLVTFSVFAQPQPDNEMIFREIINSDSPYFYPVLMLRYEAGDTTLNLDDYHHLYYGYAWQQDYKPLESISADAQLLNVLDRTKNQEIATPEQAQEIIMWCKEIMKSDPFSPSNLNFMTYAYGILGDTTQALISADKMKKVLKTIEDSGDGDKEKSPWHILFFTHANDFLASKGETIVRRTVRSRTVEYAHLDRFGRKNRDPKGYFFNFERIYWKKPENIEQKPRTQGFEINGIKVGGRKGRYNPPK